MKQVNECYLKEKGARGGEVGAAAAAMTLPALIEQESAKTQERYLEFFAVTIRNRHTRRAYLHAVQQFLSWCEDRGVRLCAITPMLVAGYIESHPGEILTVRLHLAALRRLFDWLVTGGVLPTSPATSVRGPKIRRDVGTTPVMTAAATAKVLDATASPTIAGLRDRALQTVMLLTFARIGALLPLPRRAYVKTADGAFLQVTEKGSFQRQLPLHREATLALEAWLAAAGPASQDAPLFPAIDPISNRPLARPLSERVALKRVKRAAARAGEGLGISNHSFRATGITLFCAAGGAQEQAQVAAGHASSQTTKLYNRSNHQLSVAEIEKRLENQGLFSREPQDA